MITKWRAISGFSDIKRVECTRETDTHVFYILDRFFRGDLEEIGFPKQSEFRVFFDSWEAAHAYLTEHAERKALWMRQDLKDTYEHMAELKAMRAPVPT